jgi:hypothetical protein
MKLLTYRPNVNCAVHSRRAARNAYHNGERCGLQVAAGSVYMFLRLTGGLHEACFCQKTPVQCRGALIDQDSTNYSI